MVSIQNPDGSFTAVSELALDQNSTAYTPEDSTACFAFAFTVRTQYCSRTGNVTHISEQPDPMLFVANYTEPEAVTGLSVYSGCGQFQLSWNPANPSAEWASPVHYQVRVQQQVNNQQVPVECPDCEGIFATRYTFTPDANTPEQSLFQFAVTAGRCGQYRDNFTESEPLPLRRCPVTETETELSQGILTVPAVAVIGFSAVMGYLFSRMP